MELLISLVIMSAMYLCVGYWEKKASKEKKALAKKNPRAYHDSSVILICCLLASCSSGRFSVTGEQQAKLISVQWRDHGRATLLMQTMKGDTVYFNHNQPAMQRKKFITGDWYTIKIDSTKHKLINGKKYMAAVLKHNP